jgi:hypothetical protein
VWYVRSECDKLSATKSDSFCWSESNIIRPAIPNVCCNIFPSSEYFRFVTCIHLSLHIVLSIGPKVPGRGQCILRAVEIRSTPSFGEEVKPCAPCRKILRHVRIPGECDRDTTPAKFKFFFCQLSAAAKERCWMNQEWLELRWRCTKDQKMAAVHWTVCVIPPRNSNQ